MAHVNRIYGSGLGGSRHAYSSLVLPCAVFPSDAEALPLCPVFLLIARNRPALPRKLDIYNFHFLTCVYTCLYVFQLPRVYIQ